MKLLPGIIVIASLLVVCGCSSDSGSDPATEAKLREKLDKPFNARTMGPGVGAKAAGRPGKPDTPAGVPPGGAPTGQ